MIGDTLSVWSGRVQSSPDLGRVGWARVGGRGMVSTRLLVALALACLAGCTGLQLGLAGGGRQEASVGPLHTALRGSLLALPLAAQDPVSAALGRDDAAYRVSGLVARNPAQQFSARFGSSGVAITSHSARFTLALKAFGRGSTLAPAASVAPVASANRVSYTRGLVNEWWANGPLGLEQGFNIARRPAGSGALTVSLAVSGRVRLDHGAVLLPGGLRYTGVHATDATGRPSRAWLELRGGRVLVRVADHGARYPLRIDPTIDSVLTASGGASGDQFGWSVAASGNVIAIGAPQVSSGDGAVYVFVEPAGGWATANQSATLTAAGNPSGYEFGYSVAADGGTIVVGAPHAGVNGQATQGAAYVFSNGSGSWAQTAELTATDGTGGDQLGWSVGVSGDTIAAGAPDATVNTHDNQGAVYAFSDSSGSWTQAAKLTAVDGAVNDSLGSSVAVFGGTIVAGAPDHEVAGHDQQGAVYVFAEPGGGWSTTTENAELTASDGLAGDFLGESVAISGATIVAGAPYATVGGNADQGAVYVFVEPAGGWSTTYQTAKLTASDGAASDVLGYEVAVSGGWVLASAPEAKIGSNSDEGAEYEFLEPAGGWPVSAHETRKLTASGLGASSYLGADAISGTTLAAGTSSGNGAVYAMVQGLPSAMQVNCNDENTGQSNEYFQCTAQVADASGEATPQTPTGSVAFTVNTLNAGSFQGSNVCTLVPSQSGPTSYCSVDYVPAAPGAIPVGSQPPITANYSGDSTFAPSSGQPQTYTITSTGTDTTSSDTTTSETTSTETTSTETTPTTPPSDCYGDAIVTAADRAYPTREYGDSETCPVPVGKIIQAKGDGAVYIQHADGTITQAGVGTPVYLGDVIVTNPNTQATLEFTIGGRVGLNSDASVSVATERSVDNYNQPLSKTLQTMVMGLWNMFPATAKQMEPKEIQTSGGVMGIKG